MPEFIALRTRISRVTVFRNGALVVRSGQATGGQIELTDLPLLFSSQSLRVRPSRGVIRRLDERCAVQSHPQPTSDTERRRRALTLEAEQIADEGRTLDLIAQSLEGLSPSVPPERMAPALPDPQRWLALQAFSAQRLDAIDEARRDLAQRKKTVQRALSALDLADASAETPPRFTRGLRLTLEADPAPSPEQPVEIEVEYFVAAARWVPTYRLELEGGEARLILAALVAQATGEDWRDAALAFSTADLSRDTTLPALHGWRIGTAAPPKPTGFRPLPGDLPTLFVDYHEALEHQPPPSPLISDLLMPVAAGGLSERSDDTHTALHREEQTSAASLIAEVDAILEDLDDLDDGLTAGAPPPAPPPPQMSAAMPPAGMPAAPLDYDETVVRGAPMKKRKAMAGFGGAMPAQSMEPTEEVYGGAPPDPAGALPPRLRYAWMRLAGPDEGERGKLVPMDPFEHLWALLEGQRDQIDADQLRRAMEALERGATRLRHVPLPPGTQDLNRCHFQHTYPATGRHEIPGDGAFHRVGVHREQGGAQIECRAVPRESRDVYRFCRLITPSQIPLPEGPLHVTVDGTFRTAARLKATGGGDELALCLGLEPDVRIVARRVDTQQSEKGLMSQTTRVEHDVTVTVRSGLEAPTPVVLYDRLPVPDDDLKDVHVELIESSPTPISDDRDPQGEPLEGGLRWQITIPGRGAAEVRYRYAITLPAKQEIEGGNRRE